MLCDQLTVLAHPVDGFLLTKGAQMMRKAAFSPDMADFIEAEIEPGLDTETDEDFAQWVVKSVRHEYHPVVSLSSSCLPSRRVHR